MGILLALAAWVQPGRSRRVTLEGRPLVGTPVVCTALALVVFLDDHVRQINAIALVLASAAIGVVLIRTVSTLRENAAITADIHVLSAAGVVVFAGWMSGYGNIVVIDHGNGLSTAYGHNSSLLVGQGAPVGQGDVVALSGNTGHSTGPHVHFEVRVDGNRTRPGRPRR